MPITRQSASDVSFSLKIRRDGQYLQNSDGANSLEDFVMACNIVEGIDSAGISAEIVLQDSAGLINTFTGSEEWIIRIDTSTGTKAWSLVTYSIDSRARSGNAEAYMVKAVSYEFLLNECTNIFGASEVIFKDSGSNRAKDLVTYLLGKGGMQGQPDGGSGKLTRKKVYIEDSNNDHKFIATNWRAFDTIYWIGQRSVRGDNQNGYLFWENTFGFHFKSIDKIIEDVNNQDYDTETDTTQGVARLYRYSYEPKQSDDIGNDHLRIKTIVFPEETNYLRGMRNGAWAVNVVALDPISIPNSEVSPEHNTAGPTYVTTISDEWSKMSHVRGGSNPVESYGSATKGMVLHPRRIKYVLKPNRIFDPAGSKGDTKVYNNTAPMTAYQHLRVQSLKNLQLLVTVPGNVDLYAGYGVDINIPATKLKGDKMVRDKKYSGRYVIAAVRHKYDGKSMDTEMLVYRDSIPQNPT